MRTISLHIGLLPPAASLLPHRFVTVRRGSPAARSGQIRQGDRLAAVEGRPVATLPHRELAHMLRRAGNSLRLTVVPRPSTYASSLTETPEYDPGHRSGKGHRSRPKRIHLVLKRGNGYVPDYGKPGDRHRPPGGSGEHRRRGSRPMWRLIVLISGCSASHYL
ncbi:hypothetical protein CRUP_025157 [Coryphaenoides rupestris]|nr:hypothetical protein CRUP_025157 [Coryphaenoides rupestris]